MKWKAAGVSEVDGKLVCQQLFWSVKAYHAAIFGEGTLTFPSPGQPTDREHTHIC